MLERWNSRGPAALNGVMHLPEGAYSQTRRIRRAAGGADAPIYARVNVTIPKPTSYYWEPMQLLWL